MKDRPEHRLEKASLTALLVALVAVLVIVTPSSAAAKDSDKTSKANRSNERPQHIELAQADEQSEGRGEHSDGSDDGERISGTVFWFRPTPRRLPSMMEWRRTYLEESVRPGLGSKWSRTFDERRSETAKTRAESSDEPSIFEEFSSEHD